MASNPVQEAIRKIANDVISVKHFDQPGQIVNYYHKDGLADVEVIDLNTGVAGILYDVPVTLDTKGGFDGPSLKKGDYVVVSYSSGMGSEPQIIRRLIMDFQTEYREEIKSEQGAYVPDMSIYVV